MALDAPFATNKFGVRSTPLDYTHEHSPKSKIYKGLTIVVDGSIVGTIQEFHLSSQYTRKVEGLFEISNLTWGLPIDAVPAGRDDLPAGTILKAELWDQELEKTLGFAGVWETLMDQDRPFTIQETWYKGDQIYQIYLIMGCWLTSKNFDSAFTATGNGRVQVSAGFNYVRRQKVFG